MLDDEHPVTSCETKPSYVRICHTCPVALPVWVRPDLRQTNFAPKHVRIEMTTTSNIDITERQKFVLAGMVATKDHYPVAFSSAQIQKLLFLLDEKARKQFNEEPYFDFQPYDYGPFDKEVYRELESLQTKGLTKATSVPSYSGVRREYCLTHEGVQTGKEILADLNQHYGDILRDVVSSVLSHKTFRSLVLAIYNEYPQMRENSIFK